MPVNHAQSDRRESEDRRGEFPPLAFAKPFVSVQELQKSKLPLETTTYFAGGGGLGSYKWADMLRICGAQPCDIRVVGFEPQPYGHYRRLCENSQIPSHERLRSNSDSCPDNVWGWPGYAVREAVRSLLQGKFKDALSVGWQIFAEPALAQTYTPRSGDVFASIEREATRIGWQQMWGHGRMRVIRKTDDGRYAIAYSALDEQAEPHRIVLAKYVHLAVGYPAIRLLPDLYEYRRKHEEFRRVVNAYEPHDHVYRELEQRGGAVVVRGRGIVASRILQRLYEAHQVNPNITVLHLVQGPITSGHVFGRAQRQVIDHVEVQPFNWPKAAWGGELRKQLEQADDQERKRLLDVWGGTTTADRQDWKQLIAQGRREGWYQLQFGHVHKVELDPHSKKLVTCIEDKGAVRGEVRLSADFIIDATGLIADLDANPLVNDLLNCYHLARNPLGRLKVNNDFEVEGMRNQEGRLYASGVLTLGGPYAAVDSFLGLQYAALRSVDALVAANAPGLHYLDGWRSVSQWLRWARGVAP
jgi:hypothetical protein